MQTSHELVCRQFVIASCTDEWPKVQNEIADELLARDFSEREVFSVRLALEEALVNAIKHGNGSNPTKSVEVVFHVDEREMSVAITDEGPGFSLEDVPDPTLPENMDKPSGRGLLLMRSFMTSVKYNARGNGVVMSFRRSTDVK